MYPNLFHECVLEMLKLSCNVNECKLLPVVSESWKAVLCHRSTMPTLAWQAFTR